MKSKRRLKKWVKVVLVLLLFSGVYFGLKKFINRYERIAGYCDKARGHICTHYEVREYLIKGN